jgi:hypothetical protein
MVSRFTELAIDCADPSSIADFWCQVLGYKVTETDDEWIMIAEEPGAVPALSFVAVPEGKTVKNRIHIDVSPRDREQAEEVARIEALGARRIDIGQGEVPWVVMADPEDNEFCVLRTRRP